MRICPLQVHLRTSYHPHRIHRQGSVGHRLQRCQSQIGRYVHICVQLIRLRLHICDTQLSFAALSLGEPAEKTIAARQATLVALPLPSDVPEVSLEPIVLPAPHTLHDFLRNTTGVRPSVTMLALLTLRFHISHSKTRRTLRNTACNEISYPFTRLKNYRVLAQPTTYWCPEREEHGYMLTPVFKCSTNPRVTTAHRWVAVDAIGHMKEPTGTHSEMAAMSLTCTVFLAECFYNKNGKWYYAGTYRAFRMDDLTTREWASLSTEVYKTSTFSSSLNLNMNPLSRVVRPHRRRRR